MAVGIVAVSLLLSGALTWLLVTQLELGNAQQQLDRQAVIYQRLVLARECAAIGVVAPTCPGGRTDSLPDFSDRMRIDVAPNLQGERLLLLTAAGSIVYDSQGAAAGNSAVVPSTAREIGAERILGGSFKVGGTAYVGAAANLTPRRDPLGARWLLIGRAQDDVTAQASGDLFPRLLLAAGASLLLALAMALLLSRAMARPLSELASVAEDFAAGNYDRRIKDPGKDEIGVVGTAFNRMAEAVEKARALQRDFLANVSHELKTPLTSLIGFSQALVDGSLETEAEQRRAATIINEESQRVLRMAQELLDLARVETGHVSLNILAVDLAAMMDQEIELVRQRANARHLVLKLVVERSLPPVKADPERLHQILDNMLDNAVKYAPEGSPVTVEAHLTGEAVEISTTNGVGAHRPDPERLFERFYRADPSRASGAGGVGLGLAISHELAAAMHGRLWADFDGGGRLCVRLSLPRAPTTTGVAETQRTAVLPV